MKLSDNAMCAVLLCSYLGLNTESNIKPLSLSEWYSFLDKVIEKGLEPRVVLDRDAKWERELSYSKEQVERIKELVSRGGNVALEIEDLEQKGIGIVTLFDDTYPLLLKQLKKKKPPVLFFAGDITLARKIGIAIVGSRNVDEAGMLFAQRLAEKAAKEKLVLFSGGARGVDSISETSVLNNGGAAVVYVTDSLLSRIKRQDNIRNILDKRLLLISSEKPDVGFSAGRAMNRNKYIYASAYYGTFVVSSDYNRGGTWAGATEALSNGWGKVFVWNHSGYDGNKKLIERGAVSYELSEETLCDIAAKKDACKKDTRKYEQKSLFDMDTALEEKVSETKEENLDIYNCVKDYIIEHLGSGLDIEMSADKFKVAKGQMREWLKRLCEEGLVKREKGIYKKVVK